MGNKTCTSQSLRVLKVDPIENLLYVAGPIPGNEGAYVKIVDAVKKIERGICFPVSSPIPYPTQFKTPKELGNELLPEVENVDAKLDPINRE